MTITGRLVARVVMGIAGAALAVIGVLVYRANRYTPPEAAGTAIALSAAIVAALWLRRESRQHDGRGQS